ncbi:aminotransferase class V-fold PLP-dependent enzyme [Thioalkalivibrio sp. XN279]|uniref:aminotransferase class V-fold PLP-dependent enzyme n=1 Tax=Thioalkalivibrio sp. XN279 TaxID=2714953 RepID=UPI00140CC3CF|nr:aminotransferase class V-fold PLP-dependent enzyme [Thioalkalivibrio sp. XN279]
MTRLDTAALDLDWVRGHFPALQGGWVLMDNAGGAATLEAVAARTAEYMRRWPVQLGATYGPSAEAGELQARARTALAGLFSRGGGAALPPERLAMGAATTSLLSRLARALLPTLSPGDEIVVSEADHEANIGPWLRLQAHGIRIRWWRVRPDSMRPEAEDLDELLGPRTRLVCFTHASNLLGSVIDPRPVVARARTVGARCCVDGVAYAPHRALAPAELGIDWYAFSLYKVFGPHCALLSCSADGAAMLANLNHEWMSAPAPATRLEPGAWPYELAWGAAAVPEYLDALETRHGQPAFDVISAHERTLTAAVLDWLATRRDVRVIGAAEAGPDRLPTISFVSARKRPGEIVAAVDAARIGIRHGHFYAPRLVAALGLPRDEGVVRISMAHYNTLGEVEQLLQALEAAL